MGDFQLHVGDRTFEAIWTETNPTVRNSIKNALPISGDAARWGDELYVSTTVEVEPATTQTAVQPGTIAYWPAGPAICLFWGPTPASTDETPKAASPVAVVAKIPDTDPLADLVGGAHMALTAMT